MSPSHGSLYTMELSRQISATPSALICMLCEGYGAEFGAVYWLDKVVSLIRGLVVSVISLLSFSPLFSTDG